MTQDENFIEIERLLSELFKKHFGIDSTSEKFGPEGPFQKYVTSHILRAGGELGRIKYLVTLG